MDVVVFGLDLRMRLDLSFHLCRALKDLIAILSYFPTQIFFLDVQNKGYYLVLGFYRLMKSAFQSDCDLTSENVELTHKEVTISSGTCI